MIFKITLFFTVPLNNQETFNFVSDWEKGLIALGILIY